MVICLHGCVVDSFSRFISPLFSLSADDKTLDSYNIAAGATIHMVLQLRGGSRYM